MNKYNLLKSEKTWNAIAKSFDITRKKPWNQCIEFINDLSKEDIVADFACGNGRHLIPAAKHCKHVIGLDISGKLIEIVQKKLNNEKIRNVTLLHSDIVNNPIESESVDAAMYIAALHNIQARINRINSLKEIRRTLKNDGVALISVWSRWQDKYRMLFLKKWFFQIGNSEFGDIDILWKQHGLNIPRFYHLYSKKEFQKDLKDSNLKIIEINNTKLISKKHPDNYFAKVTK